MIFGTPVLESGPEQVRIMVVACLTELEELAEQKLQSFHYQFPQALLDLDLVMQGGLIVLGLGLGSCIPKLYRRRIMNR